MQARDRMNHVNVISPFFIFPFLASLLLLLITERLMHAVFALMSKDESKKLSRAEAVVSSCLQMFATAISNFVWIFVGFLANMTTVLFWFITLVVMLSCIYITYEEYPVLWIYLCSFYNDFVGPFIHTFLVFPIELGNVVFKSVTPLWNAIVWLIQIIVGHGLFPIIVNQMPTVSRAAAAVLMALQHLAQSMQNYIGQMDCPGKVCLFTPPTLDLVTPMQDVRNLAVMGVEFTHNVCGPLRIPTVILLYPFLDTYFADGAHALVNSFLQFFVQAPYFTYLRCPNLDNILLCTPDFEPAFVSLFQGLQALGNGINQWFRAVIEIVLDPNAENCLVATGTPARALQRVDYLQGRSVVVGISEAMFAVTNGSMALFYENQRLMHLKQWVPPMDPSVGVASVVYSGVDLQRDTLFGCACVDTHPGVRVHCGYLSLQNSVLTGTSEIIFQDSLWKDTFTCNSVELTVKAVRSSVRRYESSADAGWNCATRDECEGIDATIWLVPKCSMLPNAACGTQAIGTTCYPFCMATRPSGSVNARLVFVNAQAWRTGKQILSRACLQSISSETRAATGLNWAQSFMYNTQSRGPYTQNDFIAVASKDTVCEFGDSTVSFVVESNRTTMAYIRGKLQPFAIAGDTILISEETPDGKAVVSVERLTGDQRNVFSLRKTPLTLEAAPRLNIPKNQFAFDSRSQVFVPLEFQSRRVLATSSPRYFFFAQNPPLDLFSAYFDYCRLMNEETLNKFQFMMFSSYAPLRIFRIRAYCLSECAGAVSEQVTLEAFEPQTDMSGSCSARFNASIETLEYVDSENIAVVLQEADATYNVHTNLGSNSVFELYWLHPETMQLRHAREGMWKTPVRSSPRLCTLNVPPPAVGSLLVLSAAMPIHLLRTSLGAVVYTPGMVQQWRLVGNACPQEHMGHTILQTCGSSLYRMDNFFDDLDRAGAIFWGILVYVSELVFAQTESLKQDNFIMPQFLQGLSAYGQATTSFLDVQSDPTALLHTPITLELQGIGMVIITRSIFRGLGRMVSSWTALAREIPLRAILLQAAKTIIIDGSVTGAGMWKIFSNSIYELKDSFSTDVTDRAQWACTGTQLMFGGSNPWGNAIYHMCMANQKLIDALVRVFGVLFVEVPLVKCACVDLAEHEAISFMLTECIPRAPRSLQVPLIDIMQTGSQCSSTIQIVHDSLENIFLGFFSECSQVLDALGSALDYLLVSVDPNAGACTNYQNNPNIVVIVPEPVDYFKACGLTTSCHVKCKSQWDLLQGALVAYSTDQLSTKITIQKNIESLFFPYAVEEIVTQGTVIALTQGTSCQHICDDDSNQCLYVAFVQTEDILLVQTFCIPTSTLAAVTYGVWRETISFQDKGTIQKASFLDRDGRSLVVYHFKDHVAHLSRVDLSAKQITPILDVNNFFSWATLPLTTQGMRSIQIIDFFVVRDKIVASMGVRVYVNGVFQAQKSCLFLNAELNISSLCEIPADLWAGYAVTELQSQNNNTAMLLLVGAAPRTLRLTWTDYSIKLVHIENIKTKATASLSRFIFAKNIMIDTSAVTNKIVYAHDPSASYDWLRQVRIDMPNSATIQGVNIFNSQSVHSQITVVTGCDGSDCRGCPTNSLRALCSNYQSCSVLKCIGTPINLNRPLCGIGQSLKGIGAMNMESLQGGYIIFVDTFMSLMRIQSRTIRLNWPEDQFFGYVCTAKDLSAEIISIFTATINSIIQIARTNGPMLERLANVDPNAHVALTMSMSSLTAFFHQILLLPVYMLTIARVIMMCQIEGLIGTFDIISSHEFSINIFSPRFQNATDSMVGICMTQKMATESLQTGDAKVRGAFAGTAGNLITNLRLTRLRMIMEPFVHTFDGTMAYIAGIIYKLGEMIQSLYPNKCITPNVYIPSILQCACGDEELMIPKARSTEGLAQKAHWCTGILFLSRPDASLQPVYNPYTFEQLLQRLDRMQMQSYLQCLQSSVECVPPNDPIFSRQGYNLLQVITKCRQNYVREQWDQGAYILYNETLLRKYILFDSVASLKSDSVGDCLSLAQGTANGQACLDLYFRAQGVVASRYWAYEQSFSAAHSVDACKVFSGPAKMDEAFYRCLGNMSGPCDIPSGLWSPSSANAVPVATPHIVVTNGSDQSTAIWVQQQYAKARALVMANIEPLLNFSDPELEVGFFSTEGDVIHQLLDCIYLGPYARMDYWPQMHCDDDKYCLQGFMWSRDEDRGKLRGVNPSTCSKSEHLPFSCGSPNRRSVIKYLVKTLILAGQNGNEMMNYFVRNWIHELSGKWNDTLLYHHGTNNATYLPQSLDGDDYIYLNTSNVLGALRNTVDRLWKHTQTLNAPWITYLEDEAEIKRYQWAQEAPELVKKTAYFDNTNPSVAFDETEAMRPPSSYKDTTLWEQCHGASRKVIFTLPVYPTNSTLRFPPEHLFQGAGGPEAVESYIKDITQAALEHSPLYRLYFPRHKPSQSKMCYNTTVEPKKNTFVTFSDFFLDQENPITQGSTIASVPALGFHFGSIGQSGSMCFCGWIHPSVPRACLAPGRACDVLSQANKSCTFPVDSQDTVFLENKYSSDWECPLFHFSEHFGFLDAEANEAWILDKHIQTSTETLLRFGPGGIRIGNLRPSPAVDSTSERTFLEDAWKTHVRPTDRVSDPRQAVVYGCETDAADTSSFIDNFIETLFPMAQGIAVASPNAYCLRFAIEVARHQLLLDPLEKSKQQQNVSLWKRKCGSQVQLVALCQSMHMYQANPNVAAICERTWVLDQPASAYITPQCMVVVNGKFYDPCVCNDTLCDDAWPVHYISVTWLQSACPVLFEPAKIAVDQELGWWDETNHPAAAAHHNRWLQDYSNLLLKDNLVDAALHPDSAAWFNSHPTENWFEQEGYMQTSAKYCDFISDYWPDESLFPVGYHVSCPCMANDTAYRSFDNVFAVDMQSDPTQAILRYFDDQTRDADLIDSNFGASGVCRMSNFGFDMYETNTMRLCTKTQGKENVDIYVPNHIKSTSLNTEYQCSSSSKDVPWSRQENTDYFDASLQSIGTVPNLPTRGNSYPQPNQFFVPGNVDRIHAEKWGDHCEDFIIPDCATDLDCPSTFSCRRNTCVHRGVQCLSHLDCSADKMCTGTGECVDPVVSVWNTHTSSPMEFKIHTADCGQDNSYSMLGASSWAYVPDFFEAHGMCSYHHWAEYTHTLKECGCSTTGTTCSIEASSCTYYNFAEIENPIKWWDRNATEPNRLKLLPTTCDRDYERMKFQDKELKTCSPRNHGVLFIQPGGDTSSTISRSEYIQTYDLSSKQVAVRKMPLSIDLSTGFLGGDHNFISCSSIKQCYVDKFYINGVVATQRTLRNGDLYNSEHTFQCGIIAYLHEGKCLLDLKLLPLYDILCNKKPTVCMYSAQVEAICSRIVDQYTPSYTVMHDTNLPALYDLFNAFQQIVTLIDHMHLTQCFEHIHAELKVPSQYYSQNLYLPLAFTAYEFPLTWLYQCGVGTNLFDLASTRRLFSCSFFSHRINDPASYVVNSEKDSLSVYTQRIKGGYLPTNVNTYVQANINKAKLFWQQSIAYVRAKYPNKLVPYCYKRRTWNLELAQNDPLVQLLIYLKSQEICDVNTNNRVIQNYNLYHPDSPISTIADENRVLTNLMNFSEQGHGSTDVLDALSTWGEQKLLTQIEDINRFVRDIDVNLHPPIPILFAVSPAMTVDDTLLTQFTLPLEDMSSTPERSCSDSDKLELYPLAQEPLLRNIKVCPTFDYGIFSCTYPNLEDNIAFKGLGRDYAQRLLDLVNNRFKTLLDNDPFKPLSPSTLGFFEDETAAYSPAANFAFNLENVKKYMNNINPDPSLTVMCSITDNPKNFTICNNQDFTTLQDHVKQYYTKQGPVVVPPEQQMDWKVSRKALLTGALYSFASVDRAQNRMHLRSWLNSDAACSGDDIKIHDRICRFRLSANGNVVETVDPVTPWTAGNWNPFEKCDVKKQDIMSGYQETIDFFCNHKTICPVNTNTMTPDYNVDYYRNMPEFANCKLKENSKTSFLNVRDNIAYNLCRGHPYEDDDLCLHTQGMLGGTDGFPTQDSAGLYTLINLTRLPDGFDQGYFENPLFRGESTDYGFLRLNPAHIGGHHLAMVIQNDTMKLFKMPLQAVTDSSFASTWASVGVSSWIKNLAQDLEIDHDVYSVFAAVRAEKKYNWECPIRRRAVYSGATPLFSPSFPAPRRTHKLFGNVTGASFFAHPTQRRVDGRDHLGRYLTTNGFCFCPVIGDVPDVACYVPLFSQHKCSLQNTIQALSGRQWKSSHTFPPRTPLNEYKACGMQLDWPYVSGTFRDGSTTNGKQWDLSSDPLSRRCHLLDRLPDFQYIYLPVNEIRSLGSSTLQRGVCHTGRMQTALPFNQGRRCVRTSKTSLQVTVTCQNVIDELLTNTNTYNSPRKTSRTPFTYNQNFRRQKCSRCSKLPRFETKHGQKMDPESSFGIPYRRSTERVIAKDISFALCGENQTCRETLLNNSAWTKGQFLRNLLRTPHRLFTRNVSVPTNATAAAPDTTPLWQKPWVFCPSKESLSSGENCKGSIPRALWKQNRVGKCYDTIRSELQGQGDPMAKTSFCDMSRSLSALCNAIEEAKKIIQGANCIAAEDDRCAIQEFAYTPASWETSNQAFTHQTVREFYLRANSNVCPADTDLQKILAANSATLQECPATPVYAAYLLVQGTRQIVEELSEFLFRMIGVLYNLFLTMIGTTDTGVYRAQLTSTWEELKRSFGNVMGGFSDLLMDVAFSSGTIGVYVKKFLMDTCTSVNSVVNYLHSVYCRLMVIYAPAALAAISDFATYVDSGFTVVNDFISIIVQNVLPEAVLTQLAKRYSTTFISYLIGYKKQAYEKADKIKLDDTKPEQTAPLTADQKKAAADSKSNKNQLNNMAKGKMLSSTSKAVSAATGTLLVGADIALQAYELYQDIQTAQKIADALRKLPDYWTLFDFVTIQKVIEDISIFLAQDTYCYNYAYEQNLTICNWIQGTYDSFEQELQQYTPYPTRCWADVQVQDVGTTNFFACTETSVCCTDPACSDKILCAQCPLSPQGALYSTFGCNTMTKLCQCNVQKMQQTSCFTHKDCAESNAVCSLLTSFTETSYGNVLCSDCSTQPVCFIGTSSKSGQCACIPSAKQELALCDTDFALTVHPRADRLCVYSFTPDLQRQYYWNDIAFIVCANLLRPQCVEILTDSANNPRVAASNAMQPLLMVSSRRLMLAQPAEVPVPDSTSLSSPYEQVSRDFIDHILNEDSWNTTGTTCASIVYQYHRGTLSLENQAYECGYWRSVMRKIITRHGLLHLRKYDNMLLSADDFAHALAQPGVWDEISRHPSIVLDILGHTSWVKPLRVLSTRLLLTSERFLKQPVRPKHIKHVRALKNYIQDTDVILDNTLRAYKFPVISFSLSTAVAQNSEIWLRQAGIWPLPLWQGECTPVSVVIAATQQIIHILIQFYSRMAFSVQPLNHSLFQGFPNFKSSTVYPLHEYPHSSRTWTSSVFYNFLSFIRIDINDIIAFIQGDSRISLQYIFQTWIFCDLRDVMFCRNKQTDIIPAFVFIAIVYIILRYITGIIGISFVADLYFYVIPLLVIHRAYQIGPGCFPMIPTCLGDDIVHSIRNMLPMTVRLPSILYCENGNFTCLRSCTEFGFNTYYDPIVFAAVDLGWEETAAQYVSVTKMKSLVNDLDNVAGYRFCAFVSGILVAPLVFAVIGILFLIVSVVVFIISLLPSVTLVLWQILLLDHTE